MSDLTSNPFALAPSLDPTLNPPASSTPLIPDQTPILTQLPASQAAFSKKYSNPDLQSALQSLPPALRNSLINFDLTRVNRGQPPLSSDQTLLALQTAQSNKPATPPPDESLLSRAVSDIGSVVSSVPQLPFNLYHEVQQLPQTPGKLSEALGRGSIPDILQGLTQTPGIRMIPGVNTLSTLANEGPGGLLQHPVLTALDVLPYAAPAVSALSESAFSRLPTVQAARDSADLESLNASRLDAGLQPVSEPSAARLAARSSPTMQAFSNSPIGQTFAKLFGPTARDLAQMNWGTKTRYELMMNPDSPISITPDQQILQDAKTAAQQWSSQIPEPRRIELTNAMQLDRNTALNDPTLTDPERAFVTENVFHNDQLANLGVRTGWTGTVDGEIFTAPEAARIQSSRANVARYQSLSDARNLIAQATPQSADQITSAIDTSNIVSEHLSRANQLTLARSYAYALDGAGFDATPLHDVVKYASSDKSLPIQSVKAAFDTTLANPTPTTTLTTADIMQQLQPYVGRISNGDPLVAQARTLIQNGDYQAAVEKLRTINSRSTYVIPNSDDMLDSLIRARDRQKFIDRTAQYNDRTVERLQKSSSALEARTVPARFVPQIESQVEAKLRDMYTSDPAALQLIHDHLYTQLPDLSPQELGKLYRDVSKGWQDMKAQGYDPVFVHRVSPSAVPALNSVNLTDVLRTPSSVKARTLDATPYVHDAAVAMTDQAMGFLRRQAAEEYINHVQTLYGQTTDQLAARYTPLARQLAESNPGLDVASHLQNLLRSSHAQYDPESIFGHSQGTISSISGAQDMWLPKTVDSTLRQLFHDYNSNTISKLFDPVMKTFRTALIPLSVRSFMHHFVGAGVMLAAETDPLVFARQLSAARDLVNSGEFAAIKGMPPSGLGDAPADIVNWARTATKSDRVGAVQSLAAGRWLRENVWDRTSPVRDAAGSVIDNIYKFRQHMDDMYRGVAYLEGRDKALTSGMSPSEAEQAGIGLVRKTMQSWDRMTPMERQTIRWVFPFYGYMSHVLKYAFRYPMDHPFRVGVLDNFARNEANDFGQALPSQLMDALFLGNPDPKTGNVNTLQLASFNPFRDVSNYFTLAGFTGASNPVIQTLLRAMGVDPRKGAPSLYPDIAYDPVTGQLRPDNSNLLSSFISNTIPQSQIVTALIGQNDQFKQVLAQNPDAAAAMLRSAAGLPNIFRQINPAQEAFKAELQRETLQDQVRNAAMKSGDWSAAQQFPQLRAYFQQVAKLMGTNPAIFKPYVPASVTPTQSDTLHQAFVGNNTP